MTASGTDECARPRTWPISCVATDSRSTAAEDGPALCGVEVELAAGRGEGVAEHAERPVEGLAVAVVAGEEAQLA